MPRVLLDQNISSLAEPVDFFGRWRKQHEATIPERPWSGERKIKDEPLVIWVCFHYFLIPENLVPLLSYLHVFGVHHFHVRFRRQRQVDLKQHLYRDFIFREGLLPVNCSGIVMYLIPAAIIQVVLEPLCSLNLLLVRKGGEKVVCLLHM